MRDKTGKTIKDGDIISYLKSRFEVVRYSGLIEKSKKGKLRIMEMKSMFDGARDFWLNDLKGEEIKILN